MTALIPTCHNCTATEALEERHGLLICRGCWTIGGLLDDEDDRTHETPSKTVNHPQPKPTDCGTMPDVIVCRGPKMTESKRWDEGVKWCFTCRKRTQFWHIVRRASDEDIDDSLGFWTHTRSVECERGHLDGDLFPGQFREWDE